MDTEQKKPVSRPTAKQTARKLYPTNPLGIIAIFVFFIEAISASSIYALRDQPNLLAAIVYFIIFFPSAIAIFFFIFLWVKPQSFFSPGDYRNDDSFLNTIKNELNFNQQLIKAYNGPPTIIEECYKLADKLIEKKDYLEAIRLGRGYLKFKEYYKCYKFFIYLSQKIP